MMCDICKSLLNEALDLCGRARKIDAQDRRKSTLGVSINGDEWVNSGRFDKFVEHNNLAHPERPIATKSATIHIWVLEAYDNDLYNWECKARRHLTQGCGAE